LSRTIAGHLSASQKARSSPCLWLIAAGGGLRDRDDVRFSSIAFNHGPKFGQPEINLGVIPGMAARSVGARRIGKAKAMDLCSTGRMMGRG